jgi:polyphosphate kinase 2 (PPK2 family)
VLVERVEELIPEAEWRRAYRDITDFERTIADDGHLIIKFFLHIDKQEQKRRFSKLTKDPLTAWHVTPEDWEHHYKYDEWYNAYEEAFERTESEWGPWTIVEATDRYFTWVKIYKTIISSLEERLGWPRLVIPANPELSSEESEETMEEPTAEEDDSGQAEMMSVGKED